MIRTHYCFLLGPSSKGCGPTISPYFPLFLLSESLLRLFVVLAPCWVRSFAADFTTFAFGDRRQALSTYETDVFLFFI